MFILNEVRWLWRMIRRGVFEGWPLSGNYLKIKIKYEKKRYSLKEGNVHFPFHINTLTFLHFVVRYEVSSMFFLWGSCGNSCACVGAGNDALICSKGADLSLNFWGFPVFAAAYIWSVGCLSTLSVLSLMTGIWAEVSSFQVDSIAAVP